MLHNMNILDDFWMYIVDAVIIYKLTNLKYFCYFWQIFLIMYFISSGIIKNICNVGDQEYFLK